MAWGDRWQVKFAPEKTQAMVVSSSHENARELRGKLMGDNNFIPLQDSMNILAVEVDSRLLFDRHFEDVVGKKST